MRIPISLLWLTFFSMAATAQTPDAPKSTTGQSPPTNATGPRSVYETYQSVNQVVGSGTSSVVTTIDNRYEGQHGSPYFLPDWQTGDIELTTGKRYTATLLKFNAYKQQLLVLKSKSDSIIISTDQVNRFTLQNTDGLAYQFEHIPSAKTDDQSLKNGYFMVLYAGKTALLKRVAKSYKAADYKSAYSNDVRYDAYSDEFSYYLLKPDLTLTKVKLNKKAMLDALSDRADALKIFIDGQKLTLKTEADAVAVVKQYNSL